MEARRSDSGQTGGRSGPIKTDGERLLDLYLSREEWLSQLTGTGRSLVPEKTDLLRGKKKEQKYLRTMDREKSKGKKRIT